MPSITSANVANAIVKLVAADALPALVGNLVLGNLVNRDYEPVLAQAGDTVNVPIAPQLVATLDRAIEFCQSTLTYGAARERAPLRHAFDLQQLVGEIVETAEAAGAGLTAGAVLRSRIAPISSVRDREAISTTLPPRA